MSIVPDGENAFRVTWRDPATGRRRQRSLPTMGAAREFQAALDRATPPVADPATVTGLCQQAVAARAVGPRAAELTGSVCRNSIAPFFADRPVAHLSRADVQAWVNWMVTERHYSASTVRHHFQVLAAATRWAVQCLLLQADPCRGVQLPRPPRPAAPPAVFQAPAPARVGSGSVGATRGHSRAVGSLARIRAALNDPFGSELGAFLHPQQPD